MSASATFDLPPVPTTLATSASAAEPVSDVHLFHTSDGGEIEIVNGLVTLADGLETAVYLSLFGGNEQDSGLEADAPRQWWGNLSETDPAHRYRSETQYLVRALPAVPANLRRLEDAVLHDLAWMRDEVARSLDARVTMPAHRRLEVLVSIELQSGTKYRFRFATAWERA